MQKIVLYDYRHTNTLQKGNRNMLFSELSKLTKGECTQEEYDAVNAVYMTLDDMTKEDAAKLWKKLYLKKHKEAAKAKLEKQHSIEYLRTLEPGHMETIKGEGVLIVEKHWEGDYDRHERRNIFLKVGSIAKGFKDILLGWVSAGGWYVVTGNPGKITRKGKLLLGGYLD